MSKPANIFEVQLGRKIETTAPHPALQGGDGRVYSIGSKGAFAVGGPLIKGIALKSLVASSGTLTADQVVGGHISFPNDAAAITLTLPTPAEIYQFLTREVFDANGDLEGQFAAPTAFEEPSATVQAFECTFVTSGGGTRTLVMNGNTYFPDGISDSTAGSLQIGNNRAITLLFMPSSFSAATPSIAVVPVGGRRESATSTDLQDWEDVLALDPVSGPHTPQISDGQQLKFVGGVRIAGFNLDTGPTDTNAISIGAQATALNGGTAVGSASSATGPSTSTSLGNTSTASGTDSVAVGSVARALATNAVAVGSTSTASQLDSIALGKNSNAAHTNSVAVGANVSTTAADQIRLGTTSHTVSVPGKFQMEPLASDTSLLLPTIPTFPGPPGENSQPDGSLMVDTASNFLNFRSGGAWIPAPFGAGGVGNLNQVLTVGNTTSGVDIVMSGADNIWTKYQSLTLGSPVGSTLNSNQLLDTSQFFRTGLGPGQTDTLPSFAVLSPLMQLNQELTWNYWNASSEAVTLAAGASNEFFAAGSDISTPTMQVPANTVARFQMVKKIAGVSFYNVGITGPGTVSGTWANTLVAGNTTSGTNPNITSGDQIQFLGPALIGTSGNLASGTGGNAIAIGGTTNTALAGIAVGAFSIVSADLGVAVGNQAKALHDSSAAFGPLAETTEPLQVRLGANSTFVSCPTYLETGDQEIVHFADAITTFTPPLTGSLDTKPVVWNTKVLAKKRGDPAYLASPPYSGIPLRPNSTYKVVANCFFFVQQVGSGTGNTQYGRCNLTTLDALATKTTWASTVPWEGGVFSGSNDGSSFDTYPGMPPRDYQVSAVIFTGALPETLFLEAQYSGTGSGVANTYRVSSQSTITCVRII